MTKTLIMTVGLPQSGKTSWCVKQGHPIVCPDAIRLGLHGKPFIGEAEEFVWAIAKVMVRSLFHAGHHSVILDATNTTAARRDNWKSKAWVRRMVIVGDVTDEAVDLYRKRARLTCTNDEHAAGLIGAIERMQEQFEAVRYTEFGDWETGDTPNEDMWDFLVTRECGR